MSSGELVLVVRPGGCLVVEGAGFRQPWRMPAAWRTGQLQSSLHRPEARSRATHPSEPAAMP